MPCETWLPVASHLRGMRNLNQGLALQLETSTELDFGKWAAHLPGPPRKRVFPGLSHTTPQDQLHLSSQATPPTPVNKTKVSPEYSTPPNAEKH